MLCRLCNTEKEKLCKAHLIPESFYKYMYPDGKIEGNALRMVLHEVDHLKKSRIGLYDDGILCASCDQLLGRLDEYGKDALLDNEPNIVYASDGTEIFALKGLDVTKLALFFLSVLWRCSVSQRQELSYVNIGTKFENKIRELLYLKKGTIDDFPIVITRYKYLNENYKKMFFLPKPLKMEALNYYYVYFPNGYKVLIKVDSRTQHRELDALTLKEGKEVHVICYDLFEATDEYAKTSVRVKSIGKI